MELVDVVIAVHTYARPVERAVNSVLMAGHREVTATVVAHNIDPGPLKERLSHWGERVRVLHLVDNIPSPAGPLNYGLAASRARYVMFLGSDDYYEGDAPFQAATYAERYQLQVVLLGCRDYPGGREYFPTRPLRSRSLDPVRDRLVMRTGPIYCIKRDLIEQSQLQMSAKLRTGEDLAFSTGLWVKAQRIGFLRCSNTGLVVVAGQGQVSQRGYDIAELLKPVQATKEFLEQNEVPAYLRSTIALRLLRHNLVPLLVRSETMECAKADFAGLVAALQFWRQQAQGQARALSRAELALISQALSSSCASDLSGAYPRGWRQVLTPRLVDNVRRYSRLRLAVSVAIHRIIYPW